MHASVDIKAVFNLQVDYCESRTNSLGRNIQKPVLAVPTSFKSILRAFPSDCRERIISGTLALAV